MVDPSGGMGRRCPPRRIWIPRERSRRQRQTKWEKRRGWRQRGREVGERVRRRGEEREGGGEEGEGESRVGVREEGFANVSRAVNFFFFGLN